MSQKASSISKDAGIWAALWSAPQLLWMTLRVANMARYFDVVYANTAKSLLVGGPAACLARRPLVYHLHDIISAGHFGTTNRQALIMAANLCARAVIANSEATKGEFIASGGKAQGCVVIPNGFDLSKPAPSEASRSDLRRNYGIPIDAWIVLMAGRLSQWKGQHILLDALKMVPGAHAVMLGEALFTDADREYAQSLRHTAQGPELAGRVHFVGFQLITQPFFTMADVVVHASVSAEPFGRVIVEGMLAKKPVIATRAGGAEEIIEDGRTGLLVEAGRANELAEALIRLQSQPDFASSLAIAGYHEARKTYSLIAVRQQVDEVIKAAVRPGLRLLPSLSFPSSVVEPSLP